jgi:pseudouridine synthase
MEERLQKILARAGVASRRKAEDFIRQGRVTVNGKVADALGTKADPERDDIRFDGERLRLKQAPIYLLLNKPKGYVTTLADPQGRPTVADLLGRDGPRLFPVGRLDYDTEGALIMTNDGELAQLLTHPSHGIPKTYRAQVKGVPKPSKLARLERGVKIGEGRPARAQGVRLIESGEDRAVIDLSVTEGRHHQVKRMFTAIGHPVRKLRRLAVGPVRVEGLKPGAFRPLTAAEVAQLRAAALHEGGENAE